MKRIFCQFFMIICMFAAFSLHVSAIDADTIVRVGLYYGSSALDSAKLDNDDADGRKGYRVGYYDEDRDFYEEDEFDNELITVEPDGNGLRVLDTESGDVLYETDSDTLAIQPRSKLTWFKQNVYRGGFEYRNTDGAITVINYVGMDDYVKGVLPYEMTPSWNIEALKAQAVCSRSYAWGSMGKHEEAYGFDVCNTTNCQVYRGATQATENSDNAVDETAGEILYYEDKPVIGFFFSSDGGATEDAKNVWGYDYPYLRGVKDPYEDTETAYVGYWSKTLTAEEIGEKLRAAGKAIGEVCNVAITQVTAMGNVNELTITDTDGKMVVLTNASCRTTLGLNSIRYTVTGSEGTSGSVRPTRPVAPVGVISRLLGSPIAIASTVDGSAGDAGVSAAGSSFTFDGAGWGHHVGMSQHGAKCMADKGFDYEEILTFYFTDIEVGD